MKFDLEKDKLLILLLITDLAFIILHTLNVYSGIINNSLYLLSRDRGFAEFFQYTKELWVAVLFLLLGLRKKHGQYFVFSLLFIYLLADDYFEIHESMGKLIAEMLNFQPWLGLRAVDFGELLVSAVFGLLFLTVLSLFYVLSDQIIRRITLYVVALFGMLATVGVVLDMVEVMVDQPGISKVLVILEEGGEMLVMSVITWFVFRLEFDNNQIPLNWLPVKASSKSSKGQ